MGRRHPFRSIELAMDLIGALALFVSLLGGTSATGSFSTMIGPSMPAAGLSRIGGAQRPNYFKVAEIS